MFDLGRCRGRADDALHDARSWNLAHFALIQGTTNAVDRSELQRNRCESSRIAAELESALALRRSGADPKALRRALRRIEELLDE